LIRVSIEGEPQKGKPALIGILTGMYVGNALFLRAEDQPNLFRRGEDNVYLTFLYEAAFGLVGGGIGYLVGLSQSHDIVFDFSGSEGENALSWERLSEGSSEAPRKTFLHFSVQGSWVSGPLPHADESDYYGPIYYYGFRDVTSLNMMRKLQLTYSVTEFCDVGLAVMWLGQPSLGYYAPNPEFTSWKLDLTGEGYYAVGVIQPLWKLGWRNVQWDVGLGLGMASVDFRAASQSYAYPYPLSSGVSIEKKKTTFSAMISTELKVFVVDNFSIGLAADLVYLPEDVPDVQGFNFQSKTLGTRSLGFVLGSHL
jgi:hypothetical protein